MTAPIRCKNGNSVWTEYRPGQRIHVVTVLDPDGRLLETVTLGSKRRVNGLLPKLVKRNGGKVRAPNRRRGRPSKPDWTTFGMRLTVEAVKALHAAGRDEGIGVVADRAIRAHLGLPAYGEAVEAQNTIHDDDMKGESVNDMAGLDAEQLEQVRQASFRMADGAKFNLFGRTFRSPDAHRMADEYLLRAGGDAAP